MEARSPFLGRIVQGKGSLAEYGGRAPRPADQCAYASAAYCSSIRWLVK